MSFTRPHGFIFGQPVGTVGAAGRSGDDGEVGNVGPEYGLEAGTYQPTLVGDNLTVDTLEITDNGGFVYERNGNIVKVSGVIYVDHEEAILNNFVIRFVVPQGWTCASDSEVYGYVLVDSSEENVEIVTEAGALVDTASDTLYLEIWSDNPGSYDFTTATFQFEITYRALTLKK